MRKGDLVLGEVKRDQFGPWLRAGAVSGIIGGMKMKEREQENAELVWVEGLRNEGDPKEGSEQVEEGGDKEGSKKEAAGRVERGCKKDAQKGK